MTCIYCSVGMVAKDYCDSAMMAVTRAQDLFPQFQSEARDCTDINGILLGNYQLVVTSI